MASRYDELARAALAESTAAANVGDWVEDRVREDAPEVTDVVYASAQAGYRGWSWIVSVAEVEGEAPTIMELGLLPGEDSLVAPEWIPWSVRLAEWQAQQAVTSEAAADAAAEGEGADLDEDDDLDADEDEDDLDEDDDVLDDDIPLEDMLDEDDDPDEVEDTESRRVTHSGDIDGIDIDDLDDDSV